MHVVALGFGLGFVVAAAIGALRLALGLTGACVLALLGARTLWSAFRVRLGGESVEEVASPGRAFLTAPAATASNPTTILSWAAVFAAASTASAVDGTGATLLLCLGVGRGTLTWFTTLSLGLAAIRTRVGDRLLQAVDVGSGLGLLLFSGALGVRAARDA